MKGLFQKYPGLLMYADDGLFCPEKDWPKPNFTDKEAGVFFLKSLKNQAE